METFLVTAVVLLLTLGTLGYLTDRRGPDDAQKSKALTLLPGDIEYQSPSGNFRFYFPVTTSIVLSLVLSLVMRFFS